MRKGEREEERVSYAVVKSNCFNRSKTEVATLSWIGFRATLKRINEEKENPRSSHRY